jgi:PIN domain nuclease of toxin-antitoxin system
VRLLLDTHLLLWAAYEPEKLAPALRNELTDPSTELEFSSASIWEIAIKVGLRRPDFVVDPRVLRTGLIDNGYRELPVTSAHAAAVVDLPPHHSDPFDRMLVAQSRLEGIVLLTRDRLVAQYGPPTRLV